MIFFFLGGRKVLTHARYLANKKNIYAWFFFVGGTEGGGGGTENFVRGRTCPPGPPVATPLHAVALVFALSRQFAFCLLAALNKLGLYSMHGCVLPRYTTTSSRYIVPPFEQLSQLSRSYASRARNISLQRRSRFEELDHRLSCGTN